MYTHVKLIHVYTTYIYRYMHIHLVQTLSTLTLTVTDSSKHLCFSSTGLVTLTKKWFAVLKHLNFLASLWFELFYL